MRALIKKIGLMVIISLTVVFGGCAGPSNMSVGVGVGIPNPYPGPPSTTIWIGRPTPRTLYNHAPGNHSIYYGINDVSRISPESGTLLVNIPD